MSSLFTPRPGRKSLKLASHGPAGFLHRNGSRNIAHSARAGLERPAESAEMRKVQEETTTMLRITRGVIAGLAMLVPAALSAAGEQPTPVGVLFESRHLDLVPQGNDVKYKFTRTVSDKSLLGEEFSDDVRVAVKKVSEKGDRDVKVTVFTGERQRPQVEYDALSINPLFVWFLDRSVDNYRLLSGGKQPYLKGKFSKAFEDKATIEPTKIDYQGKSVDGFKITVAPYKDDEARDKMQGYEISTFTITVSKDVPGYFFDLLADIQSTKAGTGKLQERVSLVEVGATQ
jgi:hypothetical protein